MLQLTKKELSIIKDILHRTIPDRTVWAFGSRVKGTTKKTADLDLAVLGRKSLTLFQSGRLADEFEISLLPFKVDIVDWATCSPQFREIIAENKIVIQGES